MRCQENRGIWTCVLALGMHCSWLLTSAQAQTAANGVSPSQALPQQSVTAAMMFWLFSAVIVGGALFVITRRNLIAAVMGMVGLFVGVAVVYVMLHAQFLAVMQVLVYAGAVMVLFVFVVMILNKPEDDPWARTGYVGKGLSIGAIVYLLVRICGVLYSVGPEGHEIEPNEAFGSTQAVGHVLFTDYLFPFEAVSLVLLIAIVGAIAIVRFSPARHKEETA